MIFWNTAASLGLSTRTHLKVCLIALYIVLQKFSHYLRLFFNKWQLQDKKILSYLVVIPSNTLAFLTYCHEITTVTSPKFKHLIWTLIVIVTFELNKLSSSIWIQVKFKAQDCIWILIKILLRSSPNGQQESCFKCPNIPLKISYFSEASSYFFWFNLFLHWLENINQISKSFLS
jgi:hypothetical protein